MGTADADVTETEGKKFLNVGLNADDEPDQLQLELYPQVGVFAGGAVRPGTYSLDGTEAVFLERAAFDLELLPTGPR